MPMSFDLEDQLRERIYELNTGLRYDQCVDGNSAEFEAECTIAHEMSKTDNKDRDY